MWIEMRVLRDEDNRRLLDGIGLWQDRGHLLRFLETEGVEPTNNRAGRIIRPAVIARKVSHCSKNERGAYAFVVFLSLARTACKALGAPVAQTYRVDLLPAPAARLSITPHTTRSMRSACVDVCSLGGLTSWWVGLNVNMRHLALELQQYVPWR